MNKLYIIFLSFVLLISLVSASYHDSSISSNAQVSINADVSSNANVDSNASATAYSNDGVIQVSGIDLQAKVKTKVNFSSVDSQGNLRAQFSNGRFASLRVLPETASATAQARINASCQNNNCTLELKEVGFGNNAKLIYEVRAEKEGRFLGIFKTKAKVKVQIDAETGEVVAVKKPFLVSIKENTSVKTTANANVGAQKD